MTDPWFPQQFAQKLAWFALLALLALLEVFARRGLFRRTVVFVWTVVISFGAVCFGGFMTGLILGQPGYVVRPLLVLGVVLTVTFGATLRPLRRMYWEAETRRTVAQDI